MFTDKWLVCVDCGRRFLWDAGEQSWYFEKNLEHEPKRCKKCRERKRDERLHEPRKYSKVSCDNCGNTAYVPFVPLGIKPVYCRMCFTNLRD